MKTILITGSRGFLAGHLVAELRRRGLGRGLALLDVDSCDLRDPAATRRSIRRISPAVVFHLAGTTRPAGWDGLWEAHVTTTMNLLEAAALLPRGQRPKVVVAGSSAEYGRPGARTVREDHPCRPVTLYGAAKLSQSLAALSFRHELPVVVARIFNAVGPGIPASLALGAFAEQLRRIARGEQPPRLEVGDLSARRDFVDARDAARALVDLARAGIPGETYNVASGKAVPVSELLTGLIAASGLKVAVRADPARLRRLRPHEVASIAGDHRKLTALSGWRPRITLAETLRDVWSGRSH